MQNQDSARPRPLSSRRPRRRQQRLSVKK